VPLEELGHKDKRGRPFEEERTRSEIHSCLDLFARRLVELADHPWMENNFDPVRAAILARYAVTVHWLWKSWPRVNISIVKRSGNIRLVREEEHGFATVGASRAPDLLDFFCFF